MSVESEIRDPSAAEAGRNRIEWAWSEMPVLRQIRDRSAIDRLTDAQRTYLESWREGT